MKTLAFGLRASAPLAAALATLFWWLKNPETALVLTLGYLAAIISGLWLEHVLGRVLQPGRPRLAKPLVWQGIGRVGFLAVVLAVLFFFRGRVELWAVAVGWTVALVGWVWAGLRGL